MNYQALFVLFLSGLLGMCAYFLSKFYDKVEAIDSKVDKIMISDAATEEKVKNMEKEVDEIRDNWRLFKHKYKLD